MKLRLTCLALSISLSTWIQADQLKIAVLPAHEDLLVILQHTTAGENDPFDPKENQTNVSSPLHPQAIASLGDGPIYDFKNLAESFGAGILEDELILYSPSNWLVFCHAREETIHRVAQLLEPMNPGVIAYDVSLWRDVHSPTETGAPSQAKSRILLLRCRTISGSTSEVKLEDNQEFSFQLTVGMKEDCNIILKGTFKLGESDVRISSQFAGEIGDDITVLKRPTANDSDKFDRLLFRIDPKPTEYQRRFDKEWQRETARKIAAEIGIVAE